MKKNDKRLIGLEDKMPSEDYLKPAWTAALLWAVSKDDIIDAFKRDTGINYAPPTSLIESLIDKACGLDHKFMMAFVDWFNENVWGDT